MSAEETLRPETLQTIAQAMIFAGGTISLLGGFGHYYFGQVVREGEEYQRSQDEKLALARQLALVKFQLEENLGRLKLSSPYARADIERTIERLKVPVTEARHRQLDAIAADPNFSRLWDFRGDDRVLNRCSKEFTTSRLPMMISETRILVHEWPEPNSRQFEYTQPIKQLELFVSWVDKEASDLIGEGKWRELEHELRGDPQQHIESQRAMQRVGLDIGNIVDETPLSDVAFKHGIVRVKGGRSTYYIDWLLDAAFKERDGVFYQFQGNLAQRNEPRGYLRIQAPPEDILNFETLTRRDPKEIEETRKRWVISDED